jgi:hypothetical protein
VTDPSPTASDVPLLSVIVPCYNESATLAQLLERVLAVPVDKQVIVVDDGSTDGSVDILREAAQVHPEIEMHFHETNQGKGAALHTGIRHARGRFTIVQDADLEYEPNDFVLLLAAAERTGARVVYGSRIRGGMPFSYRSFYWGGRLVSIVASALYGCWITDEPTCYKLLDTALLQSLDLKAKGFGFCAEVTALVRRRGERIVEEPIHYTPRSVEQGKKIRWTDGLKAIWILLKYRFARVRK